MEQTSTQNTASLYQRLGGEEGIRALVDDIAALHLENPAIRMRYLPLVGTPRLDEIKLHLCQFLAAGSGGPTRYDGRSMPDTHKGMNISNGEYMAAIDDIMTALSRHGIDEQTQKDVLAIAYALKPEIVHL